MLPLYIDDQLIVVDKPAGLLSVPGRQEPDCLARRVQALWPDACVVHRLDMATSGLMLFARGAAAQRQLSAAFATRRVHKAYEAVVAGLVAEAHGEIDLPLRVDWPNRPRQQVDHGQGKPSLTRFRVMSRDPVANTTRLDLVPLTGRTHQLRVHLQAIGHPILGDALYGPVDRAPGQGAGRLQLHARELALAHPADGRPCHWRLPCPF